MKSFLQKIRGIRFILLVLVVSVLFDVLLAAWAPVERSDLFSKNAYEKVILSNGGSTSFEKAFYGNSFLVNAYIEDESNSGYANIGLEYGTLLDLEAMLEKGYIQVGQELAVSVNYFTVLDTMETNPTYPWYRKPLEPYCYFQRDRISAFVQRAVETFVETQSFKNIERYTDLNRTLCHGSMTDEELEECAAVHREQYWGLDLSYYQKNIAALVRIAQFCRDEGIRLRVVFAPINSYIELPEKPTAAIEAVRDICEEQNIEVLDMTDAVPRQYFYDLGHLNHEFGAPYFTKEIDGWLCS